MKVEIEIPEGVLLEVQDIFNQFEPEQLRELHAIIYASGLVMLRRSGSLEHLQRTMAALSGEARQ